MKKYLLVYIVALCTLIGCKDNSGLYGLLTDYDLRISELEKLCEDINTNVQSIQVIIEAQQTGDYITTITPIKNGGVEIGYTITFAKHEPITIYHGQNGTNGTNGADGHTPVIGVAKDTDGVYYWTLDGKWLLDSNGNKLRVTGQDGKDGQDGTNGKDGQDGTNGTNGVTPLLKIENGYWFISYDNGATWTESGKATGNNGQDGQNGSDGKDGQDGTNGKDGVTPLLKIENGYWFISYDNGATWAQLGKATGENGKDGQNGTNGTDGKDGQDGTDGSNGQDGITPQLKIDNGYWYVSYDNGATWTQFGKATGADGQDGTNGTDGKDGITPQLKIEDGYWFITYDNGATWTKLGKATGEDGEGGAKGDKGDTGATGATGATGPKGEQGDSMFKSVTQDENYVYFTLADGTLIKIAKGNGSNDQSNDEFMFIVTYDANGGVGTMQPDTFYYGVSKQLSEVTYTKSSHSFTKWNTKADGTGISYYTKQELMISKNITLYAQWEELTEHVDLGLSVKWATCNLGAEQPWEYGDYYAWGEVNTKSSYTEDNYKYGKESKMTKYCGSYMFGYQMFTDDLKTLEKEDDAAYQNKGDAWRIPTYAEIQELISSCTWTYTTLNGRNGYKVTSNKTGFTDRSIFLPCERTSNTVGYYWSSENQRGNNYADCASCLHFNNSTIEIIWKVQYRYYGYSIRPVCP